MFAVFIYFPKIVFFLCVLKFFFFREALSEKKNFFREKKKHDFWKIYEHSKHTTLVLVNMDT